MLSCVIMGLEFYMICYVLFHIITGSGQRNFVWIIQHLSAYIILFLSSLILFIYSYKFLKGQTTNRRLGKAIMIFFAIICFSFGTYISYLDYIKGEHMLVFATMEIFAMGIMVWRPAVSIPLITASFITFYWICDSAVPATYATKMNHFTIWLAIIITTLIRFQQKSHEARKTEHIENMNAYLGEVAVTDEATGIGNMLAFRNEVGKIRNSSETEFLSRNFLFLDILNFKSYNEKHGFDKGTNFLNSIAHTIKYTFAEDPVARFSDDHFVVFAKRGQKDGVDEIESKLASIRKKIINADTEVKLGLKVGAYIPDDINCHTNTACDFARYACESILKKYGVDYCEYTIASAEDFARKQYVINNIDKAIADPDVFATVYAAMQESGAGLIKKHGFDAEKHAAYIDKIIGRFKNPYLQDDVTRVGREPLRKLSPSDRLIKPLTTAAGYGLPVGHLITGVGAALRYDNPEDKQSVELQAKIAEKGVRAAAAEVTGLANEGLLEAIVAEYNKLG